MPDDNTDSTSNIADSDSSNRENDLPESVPAQDNQNLENDVENPALKIKREEDKQKYGIGKNFTNPFGDGSGTYIIKGFAKEVQEGMNAEVSAPPEKKSLFGFLKKKQAVPDLPTPVVGDPIKPTSDTLEPNTQLADTSKPDTQVPGTQTSDTPKPESPNPVTLPAKNIPLQGPDRPRGVAPEALKSESVDKEQKKKKTVPKLFLIVAVILLLFLLSVGTVFGLMATGVIPVKNYETKLALNRIYFKIPLVPKTAEQVMQNAIEQHYKNPTGYVDATLSTQSRFFELMFNSSDITLYLKGIVDMTEGKKYGLNVSYPEVFDLDVLSLNNNYYFKANKFPEFILAAVSFGPPIETSDLEGFWVDSEYSNYLDAKPVSESEDVTTEEEIKAEVALYYKILQSHVLPNTQMISEDVDGISMSKVSVTITKEMMEQIISDLKAEKESMGEEAKYITNPPSFDYLNADLWINKKTGYVNRAKFETVTILDSIVDPIFGGSTNNVNEFTNVLGINDSEPEDQISMLVDIKISNPGEPVQLSVPDVEMTLEEYMDFVENKIMPFTQNYGTLVPYYIDMLSNEITNYRNENSKLPDSLEVLIESILADSGYFDPNAFTTNLIAYEKLSDTGALLYSSMYVSTNPDKPFYASVINGDAITSEYLTKDELVALLQYSGKQPKYEIIDLGEVNSDGLPMYTLIDEMPMEDLPTPVNNTDPVINSPSSESSPFGKYIQP